MLLLYITIFKWKKLFILLTKNYLLSQQLLRNEKTIQLYDAQYYLHLQLLDIERIHDKISYCSKDKKLTRISTKRKLNN